MDTTDTVSARLERLDDKIKAINSDPPRGEKRLESLRLADAAGVSDSVFVRIAAALRVARSSTIVLPAHHLEGLSRGRGWARSGSGSSVVWGERDDGGYRVGTGRWIVGGNDGFRRKGENKWKVEHVDVGGATWTVAS